jgi:hypothetical protein
MRKVNVAMAIALACTTPACTLITIGAVSTTVRLHNLRVEDKEEWNYGTPLLVGALCGLLVDIVFFQLANRMWSKPMT